MDWQTDILVIGTGIAGCSAALAAARSGASVLLVTGSDDLLDSNTSYAQGGIVTRGVNDSPGQLAEDILQAGAGLCHPAAVQFLAENGPAIVDRLLVKELGVEFSKGPDGIFDITEEAAHSMPRFLHADDLTGRAIILRMLDAVRAKAHHHQDRLSGRGPAQHPRPQRQPSGHLPPARLCRRLCTRNGHG
jgi:L-aspartate oxidase